MRPVSLLNVDYKIIAKVLTQRLETVIKGLIHPDQTGFMQGWLSSDNLQRFCNVISHTHNDNSPMVVVAIDAEKAFDKGEWSYLVEVLSHDNFGPIFISWIKLLYQSPKAFVKTNGQISDPFCLGRGT